MVGDPQTEPGSSRGRSLPLEAKMTVTQVVLVDQTKQIDPSLLHTAAMALNVQVTQDLPQFWSGINANVSSAPSAASVPTGAWPVFLVKKLPPGEGGFHLDKHNQPYAKVIGTPDDPSWTIDASHEICEMLVDPFGNRMQSSQAIQISGDGVIDAAGTFNYLVEACDPCEANEFAYDVMGVALSDFITPHYYEPSQTPGVRYSFKGNVTRPRQMLKGGYISYIQPDGSWNQILWVDPGPPVYRSPPMSSEVRSLREAIHTAMGDDLDKAKHVQRRKLGGLPDGVQARIAEHAARRGGADRLAHVLAWYGLDRDA
jgi:hypothetical protein